ncbi:MULTISPECIES: ABC transporter substrate-binding protein [unclassified Paenibacillus]|uniref:ABC transporter substrate-binding protein n=1 Tax=unclassified Paenibacillus TaxID=185978 RepID=UPI002781F78F|nr:MULTISPECIES: ABC transporter substrate-binding protein [unclassified Paenibacillus]MDQ0902156.1 sn-glycerol 3-phosphate transport system substrate-binding protein [Paenibacillus sp. V4I7]MDQ0919350.1 sn-glycerol 3-phosphate transport system substrate-binding protein [Paenibacillus sp. V4I5]
MGNKRLTGLALTATMVFLAACSVNMGESTESKKPETTKSGAAVEISGTKKVVFWHAMGGANTKVVDQLVANYNASQNKIKVEAVYQGNYDDLLSKLKASMGTSEGPSVVQMYEIGSRFMIDSKAITPMQNFIDADKWDLSQLEPNIAGYYTLGGKLYSMPFNTSNPVLYYNKDLFKAAGLDPAKPPKTFEELKAAADAITKTGKATGANFAIYGWFMEQLFANQGAEYVNNGNGRSSMATQSQVNSEAGVKVLTWWKDLVDTKAANNLGRKTDDSKKAFSAGQVGMILESTAQVKGLVDSASGKFEVGTGFLPKPADAKEGGVVVGGASLWVMNNRSDDEQKSTWDFIKFLTSPKEQAYWHVNTGYFPITKKAYDEDIVKENLKKFPQFQTAIDQLHQTKMNPATQGAVMGVFPEARQIVEGAIEEVLNNKKSPKEALDAAEKEITSKIQTYNKTVK